MSKVLSLQEIKYRYDILDIATRYCELKKVNGNTYRAVNNPIREEKTSSLHFYIDTQKYHDFGSNESGDVFDLIAKVENISLSEAIKRLKDQTPTAIPIREKLQPVQRVEISSEQLQKEFNSFERLNISNPEHHKELLNVIPEYLIREAQKEDVGLFLSCTRYDSKNQTLVMGWYANSLLDFELITYKRRRLNGGKWINRKGTHPNQTAFNRIYEDDTTVYIVEGARDAITSILSGLNFIAIPTTSYKDKEGLISLLQAKDDVICICEDKQGYTAMNKLNIPNAKMLTFVTDASQKIDLSDYANSHKDLKGFLNGIGA